MLAMDKDGKIFDERRKTTRRKNDKKVETERRVEDRRKKDINAKVDKDSKD